MFSISDFRISNPRNEKTDILYSRSVLIRYDKYLWMIDLANLLQSIRVRPKSVLISQMSQNQPDHTDQAKRLVVWRT